MKALLAAVGACLLLSLAGCPTLGPTPPPGTPGIVACSETALHNATLNILPSVETALATSSYEQALATLVAGIAGPLALQEVECAVAWVALDAAKASAVTADRIEATKAANAKAWLTAHPVTFQ